MWIEPKNSEQLMLESDTLRNNVFTVILHCYVGSSSGPEDMNDNCGKMMHTENMDRKMISMETMDTGFTICIIIGIT